MKSEYNTLFDRPPRNLKLRHDPVIWGKVKNSPELELYEQQGFCFGHRFHHTPSFSQRSTLEFDLNKIMNSNFPGRILERCQTRVRSQFDIHNLFPELIREVIDEKLIQRTEEILGHEPLLYQSHVNFKSAQAGGAYDWHSDYTYWREHDGMQSPRAISVVLPLAEHNSNNGGLQMISGSHKYYYPSLLQNKKSWQLDEILHDPNEDASDNGLVPNSLVAEVSFNSLCSPSIGFGEYIIMDANLWHFSAPNKSMSNRPTLFIVLTTAETVFEESKRNYRPGYITCRKGIKLRDFLA